MRCPRKPLPQSSSEEVTADLGRSLERRLLYRPVIAASVIINDFVDSGTTCARDNEVYYAVLIATATVIVREMAFQMPRVLIKLGR
jgi:hypothetical protein